MRILKRLQLFLSPAKIACDKTAELEEIDRILMSASGIDKVLAQVLRDVTGKEKSSRGREGVTAEQIVRLGILRRRNGLSYRDLSHATKDSISIRNFLTLAPDKFLSKSAVQGNLKKVKDSTWESLNNCLCEYAVSQKLEDGAVVRGDTTATETNIHYPTDSSLLNDSVRVICRNLERAQDIIGVEIQYNDHSRTAKAKLYKINNTRKEKDQHPHYLQLIRVAKENVRQAELALPIIAKHQCGDIMTGIRLDAIADQLKTYIPLAKIVIDQAFRRIVKGEKVPVEDKIFSIFEEHTDIIVKGDREATFGHKIYLTTGKSGMLLNLTVLDGNPKDSKLVPDVLAKHKAVFGESPEKVAFDGCFASKANRDLAKSTGVDDITFCKNNSMPIDSLLSSPKIHKFLMNFRAGIEGCISFLKRTFGFSRIFDKGCESFSAALHMGGVAYNLTLLARMNLAAAT